LFHRRPLRAQVWCYHFPPLCCNIVMDLYRSWFQFDWWFVYYGWDCVFP
jgi:hypothetical protein